MDAKLAQRILQETINNMYLTESNHVQYEAMKIAVDALGTYNQVKWERDIAIQQLHDLGVEFGEKVSKKDNISQSNQFLKKNWWQSQPYCDLELKTELIDCRKIE